MRGRPDPEITITTFSTAKSVAIRVQDNGAGIRADAIPDLFKAFSSSKNEGLGLGLAISKTIAQSHGGTLAVDPGGGGRGAQFTLTLPLTAADATGTATTVGVAGRDVLTDKEAG